MKRTILCAAFGGALIVITPIFLQSSSQAWAQEQGRLPAARIGGHGPAGGPG
jgi:hypothetical protein